MNTLFICCLLACGADAQPSCAVSAEVDEHYYYYYNAHVLCAILCALLAALGAYTMSLWRRVARLEGYQRGMNDGVALRSVHSGGGHARFCTCGCLLGPEAAWLGPFDFNAGSPTFYPGAEQPWRRIDPPAMRENDDGLGWVTWLVLGCLVLAFWCSAGVHWLVCYIVSPSRCVRKVRAKAIAKQRRPSTLRSALGLPPGLCHADGSLVHDHDNSTTTRVPAADVLEAIRILSEADPKGVSTVRVAEALDCELESIRTAIGALLEAAYIYDDAEGRYLAVSEDEFPYDVVDED